MHVPRDIQRYCAVAGDERSGMQRLSYYSAPLGKLKLFTSGILLL